MLYVNGISTTFTDFPDDENLAVIIFFEGCIHNCPGCQNPELQTRHSEHAIEWEDVYTQIVNHCQRNKTTKIVFSGGDPLLDTSRTSITDMLKLISSLESEGYEICVYTGYSLEETAKIYAKYGTQSVTAYHVFSDPVNVPSYYIPPSYLKCGEYEENNLNDKMGKSDDAFILASDNQDFYKRAPLNTVGWTYKKLSNKGILEFKR